MENSYDFDASPMWIIAIGDCVKIEVWNDVVPCRGSWVVPTRLTWKGIVIFEECNVAPSPIDKWGSIGMLTSCILPYAIGRYCVGEDYFKDWNGFQMEWRDSSDRELVEQTYSDMSYSGEVPDGVQIIIIEP